MKKLLLCSLLLASTLPFLLAQEKTDNFITPFETSDGKQTATLKQAIDFYKKLDASYATIKLEKAGTADGGYPVHVAYYSADGDFNKDHWRREGKVIVLINNAIHAGEPDGVDASMILAREIAEGQFKVPDDVVLAIIPAYNIGGILNRNSFSRATQNGPESYGFRGNGQNLDLNRDLIKCDANESKTFVQLFQMLDPAVFIDNHVSDGADYQHIMTLIETQHNKLGGQVGELMHNTITPQLYKGMKKMGYDMVPYVNHFGDTPEGGWADFYESPRFTTGYTSLFQCFGYVAETHMLKEYKLRVESTLALLKCLVTTTGKNAAAIKQARSTDRINMLSQQQFVLDWVIDSSKHDMVAFSGYTATHKPSDVSGQLRLYYDRSKPYTKDVPYYNIYKPTAMAKAPTAYVIPRGWGAVISRLKRNGVEMKPLSRDTVISVVSYQIEKYETSPRPYEKHYPHSKIEVSRSGGNIKFKKGDFFISLNQPAKRFLVETLEPTAPDAYLVWNFFDAILQQKEGFSDYVFEDKAAAMLKNDPDLQAQLQAKRKSDPAFAKDGFAQLNFIYKHSQFLEPVNMRYPVYRVE